MIEYKRLIELEEEINKKLEDFNKFHPNKYNIIIKDAKILLNIKDLVRKNFFIS